MQNRWPIADKIEQAQRQRARTVRPSHFWKPQPKQAELLAACGLLAALEGKPAEKPTCERIGYGGAAFGGKTEGLLGLGFIACMTIPGVRVGYFRRTFPELEGSDGPIERSQVWFNQVGAKYHGERHTWTFGTGEDAKILRFCHCQHEADVYNYQSQAFDILLIDEAEHFSWFIVDYLLTRNRASKFSAILTPFSVMTANPGGVGHTWYRQQFEPPAPGTKTVTNPNNIKEQIHFIPARLEDNPIGTAKDPGYEDRLMKRDPKVAKALRYADWDVFAGQAFSNWNSARHVIDAFDIPQHWPRWVGIDWGEAKPFCCMWFTKNPDTGRHYIYRELYQAGLTSREQARAIREWSTGEAIQFRYADPSMWAKKNVMGLVSSSADDYAGEGLLLTQADNDRLNGKRKVSNMLMDLPDGKPGMQVFVACRHFIRTFAALPLKTDSEDVDTDAEDHAYDALRYGFTRTDTKPKTDKPKRPQPWESSRLL